MYCHMEISLVFCAVCVWRVGVEILAVREEGSMFRDFVWWLEVFSLIL